MGLRSLMMYADLRVGDLCYVYLKNDAGDNVIVFDSNVDRKDIERHFGEYFQKCCPGDFIVTESIYKGVTIDLVKHVVAEKKLLILGNRYTSSEDKGKVLPVIIKDILKKLRNQ